MENNEISFFATRRRVKLIIIAFVLAAISAADIWVPVSQSFFIQTICWFGIIFFSLGGCVLALKLFLPAIVIDSQGVIDNASAVGVGRVGWDNIKNIEELDFMGRSYVGITPINREAVLKALNPVKRWMLSLRSSKVPLIIIPIDILGINCDQLMAELQSRRSIQQTTSAL